MAVEMPRRFLHTVVSSTLVVGGVRVAATGSNVWDLIAGAGIAAFVLSSAVQILRVRRGAGWEFL